MEKSGRAKFLFYASALAAALLYSGYAVLCYEKSIPLYMFINFEAFLLFFFSYYLVTKYDLKIEKAPGIVLFIQKKLFKQIEPEKLTIPLFIIAAGILFRLSLFSAPSATSLDAYRYIWEGKMIVNGYNPYVYAPNDTILNHIHSELNKKIGFPWLTSIYPPMAQLFFTLSYYVGGESLYGLKIIYILCEIFTLIFLLKMLHLKNKNLNLVLLYAWLPLPVMEYFINSHYEPIGIAALMGFFYFTETGKYKTSAFFFASAFLLKLIPLMLFPLLIKKLGIKKLLIFSGIFIAVAVIFYYPFFSGDLKVAASLFKYLEKWAFNGSIYQFFKILTGEYIARLVCYFLLITAIASISYLYKDFIKASFFIFIAYYSLATTLFPWYLGWAAALNPFAQFFSAMSLFFTSNLSNFSPLGEKWKEYKIVLFLEYVPFFILLAYDLLTAKGIIKKPLTLKRLTAEKSDETEAVN